MRRRRGSYSPTAPCYGRCMAIEGAASQLAHWRITNHARERLADRGVAPSELIDALLHPRRTKPLETGYVSWGEHVGVYWDTEIEDDREVRIIISVLLDSSGKRTWEADAVRLAQRRETVYGLDQLLQELERSHRPRPNTHSPRRRPTRQPRTGGNVTTTNIYDGIPPSLLKTAKELLRQAGLDPNDLSPIRRVGNKLEIQLR